MSDLGEPWLQSLVKKLFDSWQEKRRVKKELEEAAEREFIDSFDVTEDDYWDQHITVSCLTTGSLFDDDSDWSFDPIEEFDETEVIRNMIHSLQRCDEKIAEELHLIRMDILKLKENE